MDRMLPACAREEGVRRATGRLVERVEGERLGDGGGVHAPLLAAASAAASPDVRYGPTGAQAQGWPRPPAVHCSPGGQLPRHAGKSPAQPSNVDAVVDVVLVVVVVVLLVVGASNVDVLV